MGVNAECSILFLLPPLHTHTHTHTHTHSRAHLIDLVEEDNTVTLHRILGLLREVNVLQAALHLCVEEDRACLRDRHLHGENRRQRVAEGGRGWREMTDDGRGWQEVADDVKRMVGGDKHTDDRIREKQGKTYHPSPHTTRVQTTYHHM